MVAFDDASPKIAVVDYHKGNIASVTRALALCDSDAFVSDEPAKIKRADAVVLPGVGAFTDAMETLCDLGLSEAILESIERGVPFLGICLGMQLLFEGGLEHSKDEEITKGLCVLPGIVGHMPSHDEQGCAYKIPHVGWNSADVTEIGRDCVLFEAVGDSEYFYFTHSYIAPESEFTVATTTHSVSFPSAVHKNNVFGVQFHPEKSSDAGMSLMNGFVNFVRSC